MEKTIKNLASAFVGESQARNRYTFYSSIAKKEGYEVIAEIFLTTANQEKEHANWLLKMINELVQKSGQAMPEIHLDGAGVPTVLGDTMQNLTAAIGGENYEYTKMYPDFANTAKEEGLAQIAGRLLSIAKAEEHHEERYKKLLTELQNGTLFKKDKEVFWVCRECGYVHFGLEAPEKCPSCDHAQAYYQLKSEEY